MATTIIPITADVLQDMQQWLDEMKDEMPIPPILYPARDLLREELLMLIKNFNIKDCESEFYWLRDFLHLEMRIPYPDIEDEGYAHHTDLVFFVEPQFYVVKDIYADWFDEALGLPFLQQIADFTGSTYLILGNGELDYILTPTTKPPS